MEEFPAKMNRELAPIELGIVSPEQAVSLAKQGVGSVGSAQAGQAVLAVDHATLRAGRRVTWWRATIRMSIVEQRCGHLSVAEHADPISEGEVGRHDDRGPLVMPEACFATTSVPIR